MTCFFSYGSVISLSFDLVFTVVTDDLLVFSSVGSDITNQVTNEFDKELTICGGYHNKDKNINNTITTSYVSVQLEDGCFFSDVRVDRYLVLALDILRLIEFH